MSENIWTEERKERAGACCRKWHGTPHADKIAILGVGIDCIHFLTEIIFDTMIAERREFSGYKLDHGLHSVSQRLSRALEASLHVERVTAEDTTFGDVWIFRTGGRSGHCGFYDGHTVWHALSGHRVTPSQGNHWIREVEFFYRFTGIGWKQEPQTVINMVEK